ncbi:P antigen family member 3-like isoform X1 [Bos javanicus]|uniref:P antigen family member 3-like isoform X1 n=1 Tax=Bos javanicus TaxID=9906 RepID=UPI002AA65662|nr:P antigen family member 3-like isoform X1 [Bos javanicus]
MSGQVASALGPTKQDCSQVDEPVVDQQPSFEQPQQEEQPAEIQDITPRKEEVHVEDPVNRDEEEEKDPFEDSGLEADLQQLALAKTGGEGGDGPDVREEFASNIEPVEMPEAGCFLLLDILLNVYTVLPSTENYLLIGSIDFICSELSVLLFLYS